jgi:hypothetical protein
MARTTGKPNPFDPTIPSVKEKVPTKVPTIDELMRRPPELAPWLRPLPPPTRPDDPFGPVPIIPPPPRPPEWPFGPPFLGKAPTQVPSVGPSDAQFVPPDNAGGLAERIAALKGGLLTPARNPLPLDGVFADGAPSIPLLPLASQRAPRGLPAMLAEVGAFDPSNPEGSPSGGLPGLIQEYLRNR